ncbi:MAG: winged helix-turn-helix domain-containing protein [Actinomycetota bacterium]|nr:winged helix-turn-helix domain-containing protein [Actinomycetota bacterium]
MDVVVMRWPAEADRRARLVERDLPRLLLLDDGIEPPQTGDCLEDWIRLPASEADVRARVQGLLARGRTHKRDVPEVDAHGVVRYRDAWVALPPVEARLAEALVGRFCAVVGRETLRRSVWPGSSPGRNVLDVHVLRLRRRLAPLSLAIRTVRSRGYMLEPAESQPSLEAEPAASPLPPPSPPPPPQATPGARTMSTTTKRRMGLPLT